MSVCEILSPFQKNCSSNCHIAQGNF